MNLTEFENEIREAHSQLIDSIDKAHIAFRERLAKARASLIGDETVRADTALCKY